MNLDHIFTRPHTVIGMIHVRALPGTPRHSAALRDIVATALDEAQTYLSLGVPVLMIENMHDVPYVQNPGPEITAAMTAVACAIRSRFPSVPLGVQVLAQGNREALAVALAADAQFIRAESFVFGHLADEGYMDACAGPLLRYRRAIGAEHIAVFTDIKKKHSAHAITADVSVSQTAEAAAYFLSDGLIVTGTATGQPASPQDVADAARHGLPVLVGSGITPENVRAYLPAARALIVGSYFKQSGLWSNPLDPARITALLSAIPSA